MKKQYCKREFIKIYDLKSLFVDILHMLTEIVLKWKVLLEGEDIVIDIAHTNSDVRTLPDAINGIHSQTADNNIH